MSRALLLAVLGSLFAAAPAPAAYIAPGAYVVSASTERQEQADDSSTSVAVSGDGRYAAFATNARNFFADDDPDPPGRFRAGGVFRRDLQTGALALVAHGDVRSEADNVLISFGARSPSISSDGRWVVFGTAEALVPADLNGSIDVYARDMTRSIGDPLAYDIVSARDGGSVPATYEGQTPQNAGRHPGADATAAMAVSADGRYVAFRTVEIASDLPARPAADTPPFQLFVRDRATQRTVLATVRRGTNPPQPAGGARAGAGISADGKTVAWTGSDAGSQVRLLQGEFADSDQFFYLWRRWDDGGAAETRRITGASDPDDGNCASFYEANPSAGGPCYGPLTDAEQSFQGISAYVPALSGDGRTVAFLTGASPRPITQGLTSDLFVTDMRSGITRKAGTNELTREGTSTDPATSSPLERVALSADGRWALVVTQRIRFGLPAVRALGAFRSTVGPSELYLFDLRARTVERVVRSFAGGDANDAVQGASISADGRRIVFVSGASNLFFGDANERADAFAVERLDEPPADPPVVEPPAEPPLVAPEIVPPAARRLSVFLRRSTDGTVRLRVDARFAGVITATARGRIPNASGELRGPIRTLVTSRRTVKQAGSVSVVLRLSKARQRLLARERRLKANVQVVLRSSTGEFLERSIPVTFRAPARKKKR